MDANILKEQPASHESLIPSQDKNCMSACETVIWQQANIVEHIPLAYPIHPAAHNFCWDYSRHIRLATHLLPRNRAVCFNHSRPWIMLLQIDHKTSLKILFVEILMDRPKREGAYCLNKCCFHWIIKVVHIFFMSFNVGKWRQRNASHNEPSHNSEQTRKSLCGESISPSRNGTDWAMVIRVWSFSHSVARGVFTVCMRHLEVTITRLRTHCWIRI